MQISTKFTMTLHLLGCAYSFRDRKVTSDFIARSIGTNPVVVRKLLQKLKAAHIVEVARGTGGITLTHPAYEITFLDVYRAVEESSAEHLFKFHENPNPQCPVGRNIHKAIDSKLDQAQHAFEHELSTITLDEVFAELPLIETTKKKTDDH